MCKSASNFVAISSLVVKLLKKFRVWKCVGHPVSPDDGHVAAQIMYRLTNINILRKKLCTKLVYLQHQEVYTVYSYVLNRRPYKDQALTLITDGGRHNRQYNRPSSFTDALTVVLFTDGKNSGNTHNMKRRSIPHLLSCLHMHRVRQKKPNILACLT
jgi:hypothetical protein